MNEIIIIINWVNFLLYVLNPFRSASNYHIFIILNLNTIFNTIKYLQPELSDFHANPDSSMFLIANNSQSQS
ncbi:hypothetical protein M1N63_00730, partial [Thermodesulfovibrionales bacterium]|nr:hypothetical protein [Thermodesulfovibrionales bacterium]MCL0106942.1 hypothetical protein [Thermodesulfovibrionales bacterium]